MLETKNKLTVTFEGRCEGMKKWIVTIHFEQRDIVYTLSKYPTIREHDGVSRIFFVDERNGSVKNFPYAKASIEEVEE